MSIERAIEQKIKEAMARGEFDNLSGKGKPLDLNAYFNAPEDLRMALALLKSNEFVPEEVELLREIGNLRTLLKDSVDEPERAALSKELNRKSLALTLILERNSDSDRDVRAVIEAAFLARQRSSRFVKRSYPVRFRKT